MVITNAKAVDFRGLQQRLAFQKFLQASHPKVCMILAWHFQAHSLDHQLRQYSNPEPTDFSRLDKNIIKNNPTAAAFSTCDQRHRKPREAHGTIYLKPHKTSTHLGRCMDRATKKGKQCQEEQSHSAIRTEQSNPYKDIFTLKRA